MQSFFGNKGEIRPKVKADDEQQGQHADNGSHRPGRGAAHLQQHDVLAGRNINGDKAEGRLVPVRERLSSQSDLPAGVIIRVKLYRDRPGGADLNLAGGPAAMERFDAAMTR